MFVSLILRNIIQEDFLHIGVFKQYDILSNVPTHILFQKTDGKKLLSEVKSLLTRDLFEVF